MAHNADVALQRLVSSDGPVDFMTSDEAGLADVYYNRPGVAIVRWYAPCEAVYLEWHGWADSAEYRELNEAGLRALKEHQATRFLSDLRDRKVIKKSDQDWLSQDWYPRALALGLAHIAFVVSKSGLAMMNIRDIVGGVTSISGLKAEYFTTVEEACEWLNRTTSA